MTRAISVLLGLGLLAATGVAADSPTMFQEHAAVQESLNRVHPRMRARWLRERGIEDPYYTTFHRPESSGLACIGRWPWGPSWELAGRDTFLYLGSGSGIRILSISDSVHPRMRGQINARGLVSQVVVQDSLLFVACGSCGAQIYSVANPASPRELGSMDAVIGDLCVQDTFCYTAGGDNFRIYNVSNPASPVFRGACSDSGDLVSVAGSAAFLGGRWGLYVLDVSNPTSPHRVGSWGGAIEQMQARGHLCYVTTFNPSQPGEITFHVLDVAVPSLPYQLGSLDSAGGNDVFLFDTLAFGAGENDFNRLTVISIADSTAPRLIGWDATRGWSMGIWASGLAQETFVGCHWEGLQVYDTRNTTQPVRDAFLLGADQSVDIHIDNGRAYVANEMAGLYILDATNPMKLTTLGSYDTAWQRPFLSSAVARDSFAYIGWSNPRFRSLNVSDPTMPTPAGTCVITNPPEDMVIRDSFIYVAEIGRFQIVNVARPREPALAGSCVTSTDAGDVRLTDSIAYISGSPLKVINVARPDSPQVVGSWSRGVSGLDVVDTILYAVGQNAQFWALSVTDPASPQPLDSTTLPSYDGADVLVIGSTAYASENVIRILDVSDPGNLRIVGQADVPYWTRRLVHAAPYLYACCAEGGVSVLETVPPGVEESGDARRPRGLSALPSVSDGRLVVEAPTACLSGELAVFDVAGKEVVRLTLPARQSEPAGRWPVDLSRLSSGVYVLRLEGGGVTEIGKVIINRRQGMRNTCLLLVGAVTCLSALVTAYHVEPKTAVMSGKASGDPQTGGVSQILTINFDELDSTSGSYCELFAGSRSGGGAYHVSVRTYPGDVEIAAGNAGGNVDHEWVKFNLAVDLPESIVRGKKLEFRFTRSGSDSVQYYWAEDPNSPEEGPYRYGHMIVGGQAAA